MAPWILRVLAFAAVIFTPLSAMSQTPAPPALPTTSHLLQAVELDQLVAPIAL